MLGGSWNRSRGCETCPGGRPHRCATAPKGPGGYVRQEPLRPTWAMHAELATQGLQKWRDAPPELSDAELYDASARAHATFAGWAMSLGP